MGNTRIAPAPDIEAEAAAILQPFEGLTLADRLLATATDHGESPALSWRDASGSWTSATWAQVREDVLAIAAGFADLGLQAGDTAAIMMGNRPEHLLADQGIMHAGGVSLTVYATFAPAQVAFVAADAAVRIAVLEGADQLTRWQEALDGPAGPHHVVLVDPDAIPPGDRYLTFADLLRRGRERLAADRAMVESRWRGLRQADPVTLLYTSGTTGTPKGVLLTHRNVLFEAESVRRITGLGPGAISVSYLPYAHIAERNLGIYCPIHLAGHVYLCPDPAELSGVLREARPTTFFAVPRVWEKLQSGLSALLAAHPDEQARTRIMDAMEVGRAHVEARQRGGTPTPDLDEQFDKVDAAVLAGLREAIGLDRTLWFSSASAPLPPAVARFFSGLGIVICDVYGMTETTGAVTANTPDSFALGTVGRTIAGCEVAIAPDGEILLRGPLITPGYLNRPDLTADLIDADGWVHTGDIGTIDSDSYLSIVDRKKELLITSGGENIAPAAVENLLKEHPLVGQALAYGDGRRYVTALITLDGDMVPAWCAQHGVEPSDLPTLVGDPRMLAEIGEAVDAANARLARVQQVKRWRLLPSEWTAESEELTPTLKLKRRTIYAKYAAELDALYNQ